MILSSAFQIICMCNSPSRFLQTASSIEVHLKWALSVEHLCCMHGPLKTGCLFSCNENNSVHFIYLYNLLRWHREVSRSQANTCYPIQQQQQQQLLLLLLLLLLLGYAVAQLVKALRYKPEGRGFHSRWCHWNSSLT